MIVFCVFSGLKIQSNAVIIGYDTRPLVLILLTFLPFSHHFFVARIPFNHSCRLLTRVGTINA